MSFAEKTADESADDETDWLYGGEKYRDGKVYDCLTFRKKNKHLIDICQKSVVSNEGSDPIRALLSSQLHVLHNIYL